MMLKLLLTVLLLAPIAVCADAAVKAQEGEVDHWIEYYEKERAATPETDKREVPEEADARQVPEQPELREVPEQLDVRQVPEQPDVREVPEKNSEER